MGMLYYGDNLDILRRYLKEETVDLVYLDPPFNSAQNYNAFLQEKDGTAAASQIRAFEDTWHWDLETAAAYRLFTDVADERTRKVMQAFYEFLGGNDMMAYLTMMAPRLVELRRVLRLSLSSLRPNRLALPQAPPRWGVRSPELSQRDYLEAHNFKESRLPQSSQQPRCAASPLQGRWVCLEPSH
jgi:hypothetical protein